MRRSGFLLLCGISLVASGCGKSRLGDGVEPWEPATEANGFHPVEPAHSESCVKRKAPLETRAFEKTTLAFATTAKAIVADDSHVYWIDTQAIEQIVDGRMLMPVLGTTIERVERSSGGRKRIAVTEGVAQDLAIGHEVYWSTVGGGGVPTIWSWDRVTERVKAVAHETAGRLVANDLIAAWTTTRPDGAGEVRFYLAPVPPHPAGFDNPFRERHEPMEFLPSTAATIPDLVSGVLAIDRSFIYAASRSAIFAVATDRSPPRKIAMTASPPEDIAVDDEWLWWIEQGSANDYCAPDGTPPAHTRYRAVTHPSGELKRVRLGGGAPEVLATGLADVYKLTVRHGVAWIATPRGVVRVEPNKAPAIDPLRSTVRLAPVDRGLIGAAYAMGQQELTLIRVP